MTAPNELRELLTANTGQGKASQSAKFRPDLTRMADPAQAAKFALRSLARRIAELNVEIAASTHSSMNWSPRPRQA